MLAEQSLREGNLEQALEQLQQKVRDDPSNAKYRIFLFQLLAVLGRWDRALNQLNVLSDMDASTLAMVQTYREALRCEVLRAEVFAGERSPLVFGDPEPWLALLMQAQKLIGAGNNEGALPLREQAFEQAPVTAGSIDGQPFEWIADGDGRLGPVLEAIVNGRYYWIPFNRIREIHMESPVDLRDVVWMPAQFSWANEGQAVGLIPTRYCGSESSEDDALKLARKTEWEERPGEIFLGMGQRMLATDGGDHSLMDVRHIALETGEGSGAETAEPGDG
jgi:type VI secretion system protein ImpE